MRVGGFLTAGVALVALGGAPTALAAGGGAGLPTAITGAGSTTTRASHHATQRTTGHTHRHGHRRHRRRHRRPPAAPTFNAAATGTGGAGMSAPPQAPSTPQQPTVPGDVATIVNGVAYAPADAPPAVQQAIWAGNAIRHKPYVYGGGHGTWNDRGYDCSGSVSYVLHAAGLIQTSMDSGQFESWGQKGAGQWITVYANPGHAFVQIAGIRLDTSSEQDPNPPAGSGPRWRPLMTSTAGYVARHPAGF